MESPEADTVVAAWDDRPPFQCRNFAIACLRTGPVTDGWPRCTTVNEPFTMFKVLYEQINVVLSSLVAKLLYSLPCKFMGLLAKKPVNGFAYGLGSLGANRLLGHFMPKLLKYCVTAVSSEQAAWRSGVLAYALLGGHTDK